MSESNLNRGTRNNSSSGMPQEPSKFFYTGAAFLLLILSFAGFHLFYLHGQAYPGRPLTPLIRPILIAHAAAMTAWMVLWTLQPMLIVGRNYKLHMTLGKIGAGLAAAVIVLGAQVAIAAAKANPPEVILWQLDPKQFLAVSLSAIVLFAIYTGIGIWKRRRPEIHKPMMLLGGLAISAAAIDRIGPITQFYHGTDWAQPFGPYFPVVVIGAVFLIKKWVLTKKFDPHYTAGFVLLIVAGLAVMALAPTAAWASFANFLTR